MQDSISLIVTVGHTVSADRIAGILRARYNSVRMLLADYGIEAAPKQKLKYFVECTYKSSISAGTLIEVNALPSVPVLQKMVTHYELHRKHADLKIRTSFGLNGDSNYYTPNPMDLFIHDLQSIHPVHTRLFEEFPRVQVTHVRDIANYTADAHLAET